MALISKISRLNRIPQLLNKKRDAERDAKNRERSSEHPDFSLNERPNMKRPDPSTSPRSRAEAVKLQTAKSLREGIGRHVDVFV